MLDERTLLFEMALLPALLALVIGSLRSVLPAEVRGPGIWAMALAGYAAAAMLVLPREVPDPRIVAVSNLCLVGAVTLAGIAVHRLLQRPCALLARTLTGAAAYATALLLTLLSLSQWRIALLMMLMAVTHLDAAWAVAPRVRERGRIAERWLLVGLCSMGMAALLRAYAALSGSFGPVTLRSGLSAVNTIYFVALISGIGLASVGVILLLMARLREEIEHRATHDSLTGVLNRSGFQPLADQAVAQARRHDQPLAFAIVDLDWFKRINDEHGHAAGDAALAAAAMALRGALREVDVLCRFGGEEFAVLFQATDEAQAAQVCERLRVAVANAPGPGRLSASIGVAAAKGASIDLDDLFRRADNAVYAAKRQGRDRVVRASMLASASSAGTMQA